MVKVYVVVVDDGDHEGLRDPRAVFSTREKAEEWIDKQDTFFDSLISVEFFVDAV